MFIAPKCTFFATLLAILTIGIVASANAVELDDIEAILDSYGAYILQGSSKSIFIDFETSEGIVKGEIYQINEGPHNGKFVWMLDLTYAGSSDSYSGAKRELKKAFKDLKKSISKGERAEKRQIKSNFRDAKKMLRDKLKSEKKMRRKLKKGEVSVYLPMDKDGNPIEGTGCDDPFTWC